MVSSEFLRPQYKVISYMWIYIQLDPNNIYFLYVGKQF